MRTYSVEKIVSKHGTVQLEALPFPPGERVEVIVLARKSPAQTANLPALTGSVLKFEQPFEPVAEEDWDALQ